MRPKVLIPIILLLLALGAAIYIYSEFNRGHKDLSKESAEYSMTSTDLYKAFKADEKAFNQKYLNKIIDVSGTISTITQSKDKVVVLLPVEGEMGGVQCELKKEVWDQNKSLKKGDLIKVRGMCSGGLMDVILNKCAIVN